MTTKNRLRFMIWRAPGLSAKYGHVPTWAPPEVFAADPFNDQPGAKFLIRAT